MLPKRKGIVLTNKPADRKERMQALRDNNEEKFIGAYVKAPIVGKYEWIYDLDLTSLYPSIIMTLISHLKLRLVRFKIGVQKIS